jgi:DNA-binding NarL/FixJ family response regulator
VTRHLRRKPIRIVLVDDHELVRAGLRSLLQGLAGIEIVAEATNGREAISVCKALRPDLVLMDIIMPELNGLDATAQLAAISPETRTIMLTMSKNEGHVRQALQCGAVGYVLKTISAAELELAIRAVARGEQYFSPAIRKYLNQQRVRGEFVSSFDHLTARQREVLQLIAEGDTTKEMSRKLGVSVKTVEMHRSHLMTALEIRDVAGLVR